MSHPSMVLSVRRRHEVKERIGASQHRLNIITLKQFCPKNLTAFTTNGRNSRSLPGRMAGPCFQNDGLGADGAIGIKPLLGVKREAQLHPVFVKLGDGLDDIEPARAVAIGDT